MPDRSPSSMDLRKQLGLLSAIHNKTSLWLRESRTRNDRETPKIPRIFGAWTIIYQSTRQKKNLLPKPEIEEEV